MRKTYWTVDRVGSARLGGVYYVGCAQYGTVVYSPKNGAFRWIDNAKMEVPHWTRKEVLETVHKYQNGNGR
jgi:hypothetical protein